MKKQETFPVKKYRNKSEMAETLMRMSHKKKDKSKSNAFLSGLMGR